MTSLAGAAPQETATPPGGALPVPAVSLSAGGALPTENAGPAPSAESASAAEREGPPWVRVVIVTFNSGAFTQKAIDALAAQTDGAFEAVIIDNKSTDAALDALRIPDDRFKLERTDKNTGFAGGSNFGAKDGSGQWILTLNPDVTLDPRALEHLRRATEAYPDTAVFSPFLRQGIDPETADGAGDSYSIFGFSWRNGHGQTVNLDGQDGAEVFSASGAAALYRRDAFEAAGGFDESLFCYLEDIELGMRLRAHGHVCRLAAGATGEHSGQHSTAQYPGFAHEQSSRNALSITIRSVPIFIAPFMLAAYLGSFAYLQLRLRGTDLARYRRAGFVAGVRALPADLKARIRRKRYPLGASWRVGRRLSWRLRDVKSLKPRFWR